MSNIDNADIHDGRPARMMEKLVCHGHRVFDDNELVEMLLYIAFPDVDTRPLARRLLTHFGGVNALFSASLEELLAVDGVDEFTAQLMLTVADMLLEGELSQYNRAENVFDDYDDTGDYLARYLKEHEGVDVVALLLDGRMQLLEKIEITNADFGTAAIRPRPFIDAALAVGATVAVFGFTRPHAALFPLPCDMETSRMLSNSLGAVGVRVLECFITSVDGYLGVNAAKVVRLGDDSSELSHFLDAAKKKEKKKNG